MRVAVDTTPLLGRATGVAQAVRGLLDALEGVDVAPWTLTRRTVSVPPAVLVRLWSRVDFPGGDRWLPDADVVHGTNFVVPPTRRPATVTVHDCWCARNPAHCDATIRAATETVASSARRGVWLHVSTEAVAAEARDRYGTDRVRVVPFGVPHVPDVAPATRPPYVLALGDERDPRKGIDVLVTAMRDLTDLELVRVGPDRWVDDDERAALLRGATVLAYPSRDEGFGFPVLEAMSVGVPVVATMTGGVPEVAGDAAVLVPREDPGALRDGIRRAVADHDHYAAAGRVRAAQFTWENHARGMVDLWREAIG